MTLLMRDQENIERGRELGRAEVIKEVAINLSGMGFSVEQIAEAVKHSPAQVLEWVSDEMND